MLSANYTRNSLQSTIPNVLNELTSSQIAELTDAFVAFDKDGNGTICVKELEHLMRSLGLKPTEAELHELLNEVDTDGSGTMNFYEFINTMISRPKPTDTEDDIIAAFKMFDRDSDGFVTANDLNVVISNLTTELEDEDYEDMVYEFDTDGDHKLNYEEFETMMTS